MYQHTYKHENAESTYRDEAWLRKEFIDKNRSIRDIASECGISHTVLEKYLKKYDIRKRSKIDEFSLPTKEELVRLHYSDHLGMNAIASLYPNIGVRTIVRLFSEYGIKRIDGNELVRQWWAKDENKKRMSEIRLNFWKDEEYRNHNLALLRDKEKIHMRAKKYSEKYQSVQESEWSGFLTPEQTRIRGSAEYAEWRKAVFKRDNYTCQCCVARSCAGHPVTLHAHHLDGFALNKHLRFDINNGITLCCNCHDIRVDGSFHNLYGVHNNTREQFNEYMEGVKDENQKS